MESRIRIRIRIGLMAEQPLDLWWRNDLRVSHEEARAQQQDLVSKLQPRQSAIKQYRNNQHKNQLFCVD